MKFVADYVRTGKDKQYHYEGTVTVQFSNLRVFEYEKIQEEHFETWRESGFSLEKIPYDMQFSFLQSYNELERNEEDDELEDVFELDDDEENEEEE